jgi:hypothetical protein
MRFLFDQQGFDAQVHFRNYSFYRLISEKTIEENILKKANEKRLLGNVAIEGGNFTTAFFRQVCHIFWQEIFFGLSY